MISKEAVYDKKVARMIYDRYSKTPVSAESIRELILINMKYSRLRK